MKNVRQMYVVFSLVLTLGYVCFYKLADEVLSPAHFLSYQLKNQKIKTEQEKLRYAVLENKWKEDLAYRQSPQSVEGLDRGIASLGPDPLKEAARPSNANEEYNLAFLRYSKIQQAFKASDHKTVIQLCEQFRKNDSYSGLLPEVYFIMMESYASLNMEMKVLDISEEMMTLFPDHELTGFSLIRLARIYHRNNFEDEAAGIIKVIRTHFADNKTLLSQADLILKKDSAHD